jgi:glycosyltransferase involved in cell wall biosynthesis
MLVRNPFTHDSRVEKEARTLRDAGYDLTIVAHAGPGLPAHEVRDRIEVRRIPRPTRRVPFARFLLHARALRRALVAVAPDVIHAHDSDALGPVAAAARELGIGFVYDAHELWLGRPRRGRGRLYFALNQLWFGWVERRLIPRAAAWMTVSAPIARHLERRYGVGPVRLVPNYPELDDVATDGRSLRDLPAAASIPPDAPLILYLGGLMAGRGIENLVAAIRLVAVDAHLVLLGAGGQAPELVALAARLGLSNRVHIADPVPQREVVAIASTADVGVSPIVPSFRSYRYSLPNKLFQYMAAGIPVVASDFPQVREVIEVNGAGVCVDTTDQRAIARAIDRLVADPELRARMGSAGRAAVAQRYNWDVAAATLREVYERIAPRAPVESGP